MNKEGLKRSALWQEFNGMEQKLNDNRAEKELLHNTTNKLATDVMR